MTSMLDKLLYYDSIICSTSVARDRVNGAKGTIVTLSKSEGLTGGHLVGKLRTKSGQGRHCFVY